MADEKDFSSLDGTYGTGVGTGADAPRDIGAPVGDSFGEFLAQSDAVSMSESGEVSAPASDSFEEFLSSSGGTGEAVAAKPDNKLVALLKSVFGVGQKGDRVSGGEKFSYYFYFTGQNVIYCLVATYLSAYLLMQGIDPEKIALVMLLVKIWDGVNDAIFGAIIDKIKFKSGNKFMPWLKMSVVLIPLSVIFMFAMPADIPEIGKLVWFAIAYLLHDTFYTMCDAPLYGSVTVLTDNFAEREKMMSVKGIFGTAGSGLTGLLATVLISRAVGLSYFVVAVIAAVIAFATMLPFCIKGRERAPAPPPEKPFTVGGMLKYLFSNKYLLIFYLAFLFSSGLSLLGPLQLFMSYYVFGSELVTLYVGVITTVPFVLAALSVPYLLKKISKITLYKIALITTVTICLLMFFFAKGNVAAYIVLSVFNAFPTAITGVLLFMFTPDCAEYGRFKTGIEAKGITFSLQTFMAKVTGAIQSSLGLALIGLFGWQSVQADSFADLAAQNITQSTEAVNGLWITCILVPLIGNFVAFCILQFYRLKDKDVALMMRANTGEISKEEAMKGINCRL